MFDSVPETPDELHAWLADTLSITIPRSPIIDGNCAPFDYLCHAFFENRKPRDALVWANRGGGKTFLGALATALDLAFKPGIEIRILAGSLEQAPGDFELAEVERLEDLDGTFLVLRWRGLVHQILGRGRVHRAPL